MNILNRAARIQSDSAVKHAKELIDGMDHLLGLLGRYEMADESKGPLQRAHSANCIVSAPCFYKIGIQQIEVDPDGNIVQVERINKDEEAEE